MASEEDDILESLEGLFNLEIKENGADLMAHEVDEKKRATRRKLFGNALVLDKVSRHLPVDTLLGLRATDNVWNESFVREIRSCHGHKPVKITHHDAQAASTAPPPQNALEAFVDLMETSDRIPFTCFNIQDISDISQFSTRFLTTCGPLLNVLKITMSDASIEELSIQDFRNILNAPRLGTLKIHDKRELAVGCWNLGRLFDAQAGFPHTQKCRALKTLMIEARTLCRPSAEPFLSDFFNAASSLESIHIRHVLDTLATMDPVPNTNLTTIMALTNMTSLATVKRLKIYNLTTVELEMLIELSERKENKLELRDFYAWYKRSSILTPERGGFLTTLLNLHMDTLVQLGLEVTDLVEPTETSEAIVEIPTMKKLEKFALNIAPHVQALFRFTSFAVTFPVMKYAALRQTGDDLWVHHVDPFLPPHEKVETLFLPQVKLFYNWTWMWYVFSEIVKLEIGMKQLEDLDDVFDLWRSLQVVIIHFGDPIAPQLVDAILTGIPAHRHDKLKSGEIPPEEMEMYRGWRGLTDLKYLREFSLLYNRDDLKPIYFRNETYASATEYYGFEVTDCKLTKIVIQHTYEAGPEPNPVVDDDNWD